MPPGSLMDYLPLGAQKQGMNWKQVYLNQRLHVIDKGIQAMEP